jgi:hypothetical protein
MHITFSNPSHLACLALVLVSLSSARVGKLFISLKSNYITNLENEITKRVPLDGGVGCVGSVARCCPSRCCPPVGLLAPRVGSAIYFLLVDESSVLTFDAKVPSEASRATAYTLAHHRLIANRQLIISRTCARRCLLLVDPSANKTCQVLKHTKNSSKVIAWCSSSHGKCDGWLTSVFNKSGFVVVVVGLSSKTTSRGILFVWP